MRESKNFQARSSDVLACSCCGRGGPSVALLLVLEDVRRHFGKPVTVTSCARCLKHNKAEGGGTYSQHIVLSENDTSEAADIVVKDVLPFTVRHYLNQCVYKDLIGIGIYDDFTHVDTRGIKARW